ncbi:hypothetical protein [Kibdelosporangium aridum]|uniref:hypothetical protein n=1 Tax=Kibdelosporangium aridum TaxID=2030 RepID=UPI0005276F77
MTGHERVAEAIRFAADRAAAGASIDEVLTSMRASGFSVGQCAIALARSGLCEQSETKAAVLRSPAWSDIAEAHEAFARQIEEALSHHE